MKSRPTDTPPNTVSITDAHDPRLRPYTALKDRQLAKESGLFICEGEHNVRRLLASRHRAVSLLVAEHRFEALSAQVPKETTVYLARNELLSQIVGFPFHQGVLACGERPTAVPIESLLPAKTLLVLPEIREAENLGLIIRSAHALGADGLVMSDKGCDPFARRVVRVSMGSVLELPIVRSPDLAFDLGVMRDTHGITLAAAVLDDDAKPLNEFVRPAGSCGVAVLLGNEPQGLGRSWIQMCQHKLTIPMAGGVDSLNVAVAAGIVLYHLAQHDGS